MFRRMSGNPTRNFDVRGARPMGRPGGGGLDPAMVEALIGGSNQGGIRPGQPPGGRPGALAGPMRGVGAPSEGPGFVAKGARVLNTGGATPPPAFTGGGGTPPPDSGGSLADRMANPEPGSRMEAVMNQMNFLNRQAEDRRNRDRQYHTDWSDADWRANLERAMRPQTRQDAHGNWEYLFKGGWVDEATWNDPKWRQNVYEPWAADVQNYWRDKQEEAMAYKRSQEEAKARAEYEKARRGRARRGGSSRSSSGRGY